MNAHVLIFWIVNAKEEALNFLANLRAMRFLVVCFALAWLPTWGWSDCQGDREVISSLSAIVESQLRTIRTLEEELAAVTAAQAECCACAPFRDLQALPPTIYESHLWHVSQGSCVVDAEGCITSPNHPRYYPRYDFCNIEIKRSAWTGRLIVTGDYDYSGYSWIYADSLRVDGVRGACTTVRHATIDFDYDFCQAQVAQERVPEHSITWSSVSTYSSLNFGWKICQGPPLNDSRPWHNQTWTCDLTGAPLLFPRTWRPQGGYLSNLIQDVCTTVWSDPDDLDGDGDFNTGWPYYYYDGGYFRCGPCSCTAGEEQRWQTPQLPGEASDTSYLSCTPCTAGRYKEAGNVVGVESPCAWCPAGSTSAAGATACSSCADGQHTTEEGASRCLPCPAGTIFRTTSVCDPCTVGHFGATQAATACTSCPLGSTTLSPGLSACSLCFSGKYGVEAGCEACRTGHFTADEGETSCETCPSGYIAQSEGQSACAPCASGWYGTAFACEECPPGEYAENLGQSRCARCSVGTIAVLTRSSACDACPAGQYGSNASATACETCDVGTFTDSAGASACTKCGDHDDTGSTLWTTVGQRERGGQLQWVDVDGSSSVTSCTCVEGARQSEHGACVPCGEGLICPLFGSVQLQPGYFAAAEYLGSVWRCHGVDPGRCPGGAPGLCARLRDNSSIACGDCEPNTRWTTDGPCETCQPSDVSVLLVAFLVAAVSLLCLYCVVVNENRARNNDHVVLLATLGSQLVTVLQMMGVCKLLSVTWPKPFSTILSLTSLLNLKLEILNVGCVVGMSVVTRYAGTAFGFMVLLAVMCLFHMVHMGVFHSREMLAGKWKTYRPALVGGLGSIFMLCYIAVVATICAPLRCESHPNGQSTLVGLSSGGVLVEHRSQGYARFGRDGQLHSHRVPLHGVRRLAHVAEVPGEGRYRFLARLLVFVLQVPAWRVLVCLGTSREEHGNGARTSAARGDAPALCVCAHPAAVHGDKFRVASMAGTSGEPPGRRNQRELRAGGLPRGPFQRRR